jgi:hypothetical protein
LALPVSESAASIGWLLVAGELALPADELAASVGESAPPVGELPV